jgi:hypothetical protein
MQKTAQRRIKDVFKAHSAAKADQFVVVPEMELSVFNNLRALYCVYTHKILNVLYVSA